MFAFFLQDGFGAVGLLGAGALFQGAEDLHFGLGFLGASEGAIGLGQQEMGPRFGRVGFCRSLQIIDGLGVAVQLDERTGTVVIGASPQVSSTPIRASLGYR